MIEVDFQPNPQDPAWDAGWIPKSPPDYADTEISRLTQADFLFEYFRADIKLKIGQADFSSRLKFVPILDFCLMLESARRKLAVAESCSVQLSDFSDSWRFRIVGDYVEVSVDGLAKAGRCRLAQYRAVVDEVLTSALDLIFAKQPRVVENAYLRDLRKYGFSQL